MSAPAQLTVEGAGIVCGAAVFVVVGVVALLLFWGRTLPIAGPDSLGQFVAIAGGIIAFLAYLTGRLWRREGLTPFQTTGEARPAPQPRSQAPSALGSRHRSALPLSSTAGVDIFDTFAIALAHGILALLGWLVLGAVLANGFQDATVYHLSATALAAAAAGVTGYAVFLSAARMDLMRLSTVLAEFAVVGILTSMLSAPDPHWWQLHLSALGMTQSVSSLAFNLTLIIAGVIVTAIARYATDARGIEDPRRRSAVLRVRVGLILIGVLLAGVGVFTLNISVTLHNVSAVGMVLVFALVVFWVRGALPNAPRSFFVLGYVFFGAIVLMLVFFAVGYYVLTAAELVAGVLVFSWLIVYLRVSGAAAEEAANVHVVED
ncbi:tetraspanin family protein [Leifsonia shinshuensis]|nr:tetraspanin family protein [Leifsonia shinshuensis]